MTEEHPAFGRIPSWPRIRTILAQSAPQVISIDGEPEVRLLVDGGQGSLTLQCAVDDDVSPDEFAKLESITINRSGVGGDWLLISTNDSALFPYFVAFTSTVADDVQLEGVSVRAALIHSLRLFRRLLRDTHMLSPEREEGLLGELWALKRLVAGRGAQALAAWLGPDAEEHDLRWEGIELEVKTTRRERRLHVINGLDQLKPSTDATLFILSLQYTGAGLADEGHSLSEAIGDMRACLKQYGQDAAFDAVLLDRFNLPPETETHYTERLTLRSEARLIPVEPRTPRLLRTDLQLIDRDEMQRVLDATYTLDCDGLGVIDGSTEFMEILP